MRKSKGFVPDVSLSQSAVNATNITTTKDKVFLLFEADIEGTSNGVATSSSQLFTCGYKIDVSKVNNTWATKTINGTVAWWWLRSPRQSQDCIAAVIKSGKVAQTKYDDTVYESEVANGGWGGGVRPAMWIDITNLSFE